MIYFTVIVLREHVDNVGSNHLKLIQYLPIGWSKQTNQAPSSDHVIRMAFLFCPWRATSECDTSSRLPGIISLALLKPIWAYIVNSFDSGFVEPTYTVISHNFQCSLILVKILRPAKRDNTEREAYIPHWGDITCSSAVSHRGLKLFVQQWLRKGQVPCSRFPPALSLFSKAPSLIPSSSQSSSACVMCSSHAHFQLLIWPGCLLGRVSSGRSLQVHEQVSSKCY